MGTLKNLVVFLSPNRAFTEPYQKYTKTFIDNSVDLGWMREDIILVTNYSWEYNRVKAIVVGDEHYCAVRPRSIKTAIIPHLVDIGVIEDGNVYWNHDIDAWQHNPFTIEDLGIEDVDVGLTDYGWRPRWCLGSYFVKKNSKDIFEKAKPIIWSNIEDEKALMELTKDNGFEGRYKRMNITYNFGMRHIAHNWEIAEKPLKVLHFNPSSARLPTLEMFMYGNNEIKTPLMNKRLKKIMNFHRIK